MTKITVVFSISTMILAFATPAEAWRPVSKRSVPEATKFRIWRPNATPAPTPTLAPWIVLRPVSVTAGGTNVIFRSDPNAISGSLELRDGHAGKSVHLRSTDMQLLLEVDGKRVAGEIKPITTQIDPSTGAAGHVKLKYQLASEPVWPGSFVALMKKTPKGNYETVGTWRITEPGEK